MPDRWNVSLHLYSVHTPVNIWPWPLTLKTVVAIHTHVANVCVKFHWNPSTEYRDEILHHVKQVLTDNRRTDGRWMARQWQWRRYTRAQPGKITWLEDLPPWLLLCFAAVIMRTENKNFTLSDRWSLCFILTVKQSQQCWRPLCFEGDD